MQNKLSYAPLFIKLDDTMPVVIVGGGAVAVAKAETLLGFGARLHVVAEDVNQELQDLLTRHGSTFAVSPYRAEHLRGAKIVIAATNDRSLNAQVHADAKVLGAFVNVVDTPELCDFIFPATVRRGDIQIAVSTAGISPTLARFLKRRIEQVLPWNLDQLANWLRDKRHLVTTRFRHLQARRLFWDDVIEGPIAQEVLEGNYARAEVLLAQALTEHRAASRAALYLIGAGPGHPDLITVRGAQLLAMADVVLYDRLIPPDALARYARKEALKIPVGKSAGHHSKTQTEIGELIEQYLRANKIVVRLKGGDPGIYAHAVEELEIARRLDVPCQIVPGITAAAGCAATAGIPLTERDGAHGVRFFAVYDEQLHDESFWQSIALSPKDTLVFYMTTKQRAFLCHKLLGAGLDPATPVVVIEQGTTPHHAEFEATLGTFIERYGDYPFITPALLIIGDVVRWRTRFGWKEPPQNRQAWFEGGLKDIQHAGQ